MHWFAWNNHLNCIKKLLIAAFIIKISSPTYFIPYLLPPPFHDVMKHQSRHLPKSTRTKRELCSHADILHNTLSLRPQKSGVCVVDGGPMIDAHFSMKSFVTPYELSYEREMMFLCLFHRTRAATTKEVQHRDGGPRLSFGGAFCLIYPPPLSCNE